MGLTHTPPQALVSGRWGLITSPPPGITPSRTRTETPNLPHVGFVNLMYAYACLCARLRYLKHILSIYVHSYIRRSYTRVYLGPWSRFRLSPQRTLRDPPMRPGQRRPPGGSAGAPRTPGPAAPGPAHPPAASAAPRGPRRLPPLRRRPRKRPPRLPQAALGAPRQRKGRAGPGRAVPGWAAPCRARLP